MIFLLIESTCDETAVALVQDDLEVLSSVVASQEDVHEAYQGVVPELAARAHVENLLPVLNTALERAGRSLQEIDVVAVTNRPGLVGSLLVGVTAAKTLAWVLGKPLVAVNHVHAHIYACRMAAERNVFPCLGLVVSGGHSSLFDCQSPCDYELLGGTIDDAAGEAFDKVASMLGLPFPGGPALSRIAERGIRDAYSFPRPLLNQPERLQFSFSGLKTAVRYAIVGAGSRRDPSDVEIDDQTRADLAASFQEAVVDCLVGKAMAGLNATGHQRLCVGGGVAANRRLRDRLTEACEEQRVELLIAPLSLCTDNAVMVAMAIERYRRGMVDDLSLDVEPGLMRTG